MNESLPDEQVTSTESDVETPSATWNLFRDELPLQTPTAFFILFNCLDIFWTYLLFRFGAVEANPFANYVFMQWGFWGMIIFKLAIVAGVCVIAQVIALKRLQTAQALLWGGTVVVAGVVAYSTFLFYTNFQGATPTI
ncbi:MAG: DUF5658 family protein [Planctomycetota bacterium]